MRFHKIKNYLERMRNATYEIFEDSEKMLQFMVRTRWTEKLFTIHYRDGLMESDSLNRERPMYHHYYLQFEQENLPRNGDFVSVVEWKWYTDEDAVLERIKTLKNRYQY